jgi:hypothetical protein
MLSQADATGAEAFCRAIARQVGLANPPVPVSADARSPALRWASSGLALLIGEAERPVIPHRDYASRLDVLLRTTEAFAGLSGGELNLDLGLFSARAAEMGLSRGGQVSCNRSARLIRCAEGWLAVNLARPDDRNAVPAWIGCALDGEPWAAIEAAAQARTAADMAEAAQLLGLPAAVVGARDDAQWRARGPASPSGLRIVRMAAGAPRIRTAPFVVDLSSLWAGPLCGHLLTLAGARVVKVESIRRPDGARLGPRGFYDGLHTGQEAVALDFATPQGRTQLAALIARADVVIEASRPRALEQLGIDLNAAFRANPALVWVSLTAFGRSGPWRNGVGFGDDMAAAGGLIAHHSDGAPIFVGDALADPVAGLGAAAGAFAALAAGCGCLIDVSLREMAAFVADAPFISEGHRGDVIGQEGDWRLWLEGSETPLAPPTYAPSGGAAPELGAHTAAILAETPGA